MAQYAECVCDCVQDVCGNPIGGRYGGEQTHAGNSGQTDGHQHLSPSSPRKRGVSYPSSIHVLFQFRKFFLNSDL